MHATHPPWNSSFPTSTSPSRLFPPVPRSPEGDQSSCTSYVPSPLSATKVLSAGGLANASASSCKTAGWDASHMKSVSDDSLVACNAHAQPRRAASRSGVARGDAHLLPPGPRHVTAPAACLCAAGPVAYLSEQHSFVSAIGNAVKLSTKAQQPNRGKDNDQDPKRLSDRRRIATRLSHASRCRKQSCCAAHSAAHGRWDKQYASAGAEHLIAQRRRQGGECRRQRSARQQGDGAQHPGSSRVCSGPFAAPSTASDHAAAPSQGLTYPSIPATAASNMRAAILLVIAAMQTHAWAPGNVRVAAWPCPATTAHAQCSASLRKSSLQPRLRMSSSLYNDQQAAMARRAEQVLQAAARLWNTSD